MNRRTGRNDALGSTLALVDSTGTVQYNYQYEPFGEDGSTIFNVNTTSTYEFTGREEDEIGVGSGLMYYRGRYYSPAYQRFISQDPIDFAGGNTNLYAYVDNSPSNITDPLGLTDVLIGIRRTTSDNIATIGTLSVGGQDIGVTLELPYRNNLPNVSSIPQGSYPAATYRSPHLGGEDILLQDVPYRDFIEIHPGNFPRQSKGCILPGRRAGKERIYNSRETFNQLMAIIHVTQAFDAAIGDSTNINVDITSPSIPP